MDIFQSIVATWLIFILGIINLLSGTLILLTCRCIPGLKIAGNPMKYATYRSLYKYHCYIWLVFWVSVMVHAVFAIGFLGIPPQG
jgi:hypothetical protein